MYRLENEHFLGTVDPSGGARLLSLSRKSKGEIHPIIAAPRDGVVIGQKATAFPLVPFGGRLKHGKLRWEGATVQLPCPPSSHVLHGDSMQRPWTLHHHDRTSVTMTLDYPTVMWPFPAQVAVRYLIRGPIFRVLICVLNLSDKSIPFGLGWHPYFAAGSDTRLRLSVRGCARLDADGFSPEISGGPEERLFSPADGAGTWQCLAAPGPAILEGPQGSLMELRFGSTVSHVVVHVPPNGSAMAVEPLTHPLHDPGHAPLGAGKRRTMAMQVRLLG